MGAPRVTEGSGSSLHDLVKSWLATGTPLLPDPQAYTVFQVAKGQYLENRNVDLKL